MALSFLGGLLNGPIQETEYRRVFALLMQQRADAIIVNDTPENYTNERVIIELAAAARLPTVYPNRSFVELGGLMPYGADTVALLRHAADQIDQILKGAKPGDIPFYQATTFEMAINLKIARGLDLTIPPSLLARADEVIE